MRRHALAGWVREQIWDFEGALADYRAGGYVVDALRVALESGVPRALDEALAAVEAAGEGPLQDAVALLRQRRRNMEVARLLARASAPPQDQAQALLAAGDRLGAAQALAAARAFSNALPTNVSAVSSGSGRSSSADV